MAELKGDRGLSKCGWCLTDRCNQCLSSGEGWVCVCTHDGNKEQLTKERARFLNNG